MIIGIFLSTIDASDFHCFPLGFSVISHFQNFLEKHVLFFNQRNIILKIVLEIRQKVEVTSFQES